MKNLILIPAALLVAAGCTQTQIPAPVAQTPTKAPVKLSSTQELAKYCRVCVVDRGEKMEEFLPSRLDKKQGEKTYKFCSEPCRKSFDAKPARYALAK
jgi:ABC-type Zn2+ transport system substrate-binding protein/surface adhesin